MRKLSEEVRPGRKLSPRLAAEVRYLANKGEVTQAVIGRVYNGISQPHVANIKAERRWPKAGTEVPRREIPEGGK